MVLATFAAYGAALLQQVPLKWTPTSDLKSGSTQMSTAPIQFEKFADARDKMDLIGENREDEAKPKPVTTSDDVGAFVGSHMRQLFNRAGLSTVDSGGKVIVKGEVKRFFVRESGTYEADVAVHVTLASVDGTVLWAGTATGEAKRFGRSYKLENYYEVLSDAVVNTVSSMLQSQEFQKALR
jgi:hypothetical protein